MRLHVLTELRGKDGSRARVEVYDSILDAPAGSREIFSDTAGCAALQDQLVLVVGILVEAGRGAPQPTPATTPPEAPEQPAPEEPVVTEPEPEPEPERAAARPPRRRVRPRSVRIGPERHHSLGIVAGAGWGLLPRVYATGELRWSIQAGDRWPLRLAGVVAGPSTATRAGKRSHLFAGYATFGPCPSWQVGQGETQLGACGLVGVGATRSRGDGDLSRTVTARGPLVLMGVEAFARFKLGGPVGLVVGVQALGLLYRSEFYYVNTQGERQELFRASPMTVTGHVGLYFRFR